MPPPAPDTLLRIVFMGTPEFALPSFRHILESRHRIVGVVTVPDSPQGRGQKLRPSAVKKAALDAGLPVLQPESLRDPVFAETLRSMAPDLAVVVAFRILPKSVFEVPHLGTFNLHASLLPKYRGAAPIQWALMNGEKETGVTTFFLRERADTGTLILQRSIPVGGEETAGELHDRLSELGAEVVAETIELIARGDVTVREQDEANATPAPKIVRETCAIDWHLPARTIHNLIRAMSPSPGAFTHHGEKMLKLLRSRIVDETGTSGKPGEILAADRELRVVAGRGVLSIVELQLEGRRVLNVEAFLRGYSLPAGDFLVTRL